MRKLHRLLSLSVIVVIVLSLGLAVLPTASAAEWGVDTATAPSASWLSLSVGESVWYAFDYAGDGSQIQVRLEVVPEGSAGFVVWTPELIERWTEGKRVEPIGRGSDDLFAEGVVSWSGSFTRAGTYYVAVEQAAGQSGTSYYLLAIAGDGVSFSAPAPEDQATSAATTTSLASSAKSQPKSSLASELEGKLVFQTTYGGPFYTIDADGSNLQRIANGIDPVWSPDGEQIAFVRWENPRGVWLVNADGSDARRLFDWSETRYPSWSPDGQEIVFSRTESGDGVAALTGGFSGVSGDVAVTAGRRPGGPPGGRSPSSGATLGIIDVGDGAFREPLPVSIKNLTPDWSPSGEQIVIASNFSISKGLMIQSVDGSESWLLTSDPYDTTPVWSPDGTKVAFIHRQHDHWEIYVVDVATGQQTRLTDTPAFNGQSASSVSPAWSPDGNNIAFLTNRTGEWEIWVMRADGSGRGPMFSTELNGLTLEYAYASERAIDWTW